MLKVLRVIISMTQLNNFSNILLEEKSWENILIYDVSYKTLIGAKPLHIIFDRVDRFIRDYDRAKYLALNTGLLMIGLDIL